LKKRLAATKEWSGGSEENNSLFPPQGIAPRFFGRQAVYHIRHIDCAFTGLHFKERKEY
jgi:hypothetical protein